MDSKGGVSGVLAIVNRNARPKRGHPHVPPGRMRWAAPGTTGVPPPGAKGWSIK